MIIRPPGIIVHHSLTADGVSVSWGAIRKYHVGVNGWADIGYHAGIELIGDHYELLQGRMDNEIGAHCYSFNHYLGICLVGDFDHAGPNTEQMGLLTRWCKCKMETFGFGADKVLGHWETYKLRGVPAEKSCPGNAFSMEKLRSILC